MKTITDAFAPYVGTKEYDGIVATIQKWFYGDLVKASWCATSVSYFADQIGILDQIGGKNENVYRMMQAAEKGCKASGKGLFAYAKDLKGKTIKRGTILFFLNSSAPMTETSGKHVTTAYEPFVYGSGQYCKCLGGNQSDSIRVSSYYQSRIYAIFEPDYGTEESDTHTDTSDTKNDTAKHPTLRRGDKGADVKALQKQLRALGFGYVSGDEMVTDGSFGPITKRTVIAFQTLTGLLPDGICGPITWEKIDELAAMAAEKTTALTDVYYRIGPGSGYRALGVVKEGKEITYTDIVDGWLYIPKLKGWSRTSYYWLD